ncbi:MAG: orotidine-5'-phosphate decarboxylase, partial [Ignavibacteria bacterium]|nr:orotidine-5'-phosphate decarboxylase [Ignavibacteria bacterium]
MNLLLKEIISKKKSHLCIGLDITKEILEQKNNLSIEKFLLKIIEASYDLTSAYKFNLAFYEYFGSKGLKVLEKVLPKIPTDILKIGDGKRCDIASTSKMYAYSLFNHLGFDAVTLNPLMGYDSLQPFLNYEDKINFILAMTSNNGAKDFQKLKLFNGKPL